MLTIVRLLNSVDPPITVFAVSRLLMRLVNRNRAANQQLSKIVPKQLCADYRPVPDPYKADSIREPERTYGAVRVHPCSTESAEKSTSDAFQSTNRETGGTRPVSSLRFGESIELCRTDADLVYRTIEWQINNVGVCLQASQKRWPLVVDQRSNRLSRKHSLDCLKHRLHCSVPDFLNVFLRKSALQ